MGRGNRGSNIKTQFSDFSPFNPYNSEANIKFSRLDSASGLLEENVIWIPNKYRNTHVFYAFPFTSCCCYFSQCFY